jgi:hypothetical protein
VGYKTVADLEARFANEDAQEVLAL